MQLDRRFLALVGALSLVWCAGCGAGKAPTLRDGGPGDGGATDDGGPIGSPDTGPPPTGCSLTPDTDGDGIPDAVEGPSDSDGDGVPNREDLDSDDDGIPDEEEVGDNPCAPRNSDSDTTADFVDTDSDNDGLPDSEEVMLGTDPTRVDSDGDGVTDLGEVRGSMTDPTDPASTIPEDDFFVVLPYEGDAVLRTLRFGTAIQRADVYFLIDTTASMQAPIDNVRTSLSAIAADIATRIPDVAMGVGHFEDFPFSQLVCGGLGCYYAGYGAPSDVPYRNVRAITPTLEDVQAALNGLALADGSDCPESMTEALYQTATAAGGSFSHAYGSHTMSLACAGSGVACPGFREGALPIVVMVADANWHNGPSGTDGYAGISPAPASFDQAADAMNAIGARFIGVHVVAGHGCQGGRPQAEEMARRTGSVDGSGSPLVFDAAGGSVNSAIVDGIATLASSTPQDVNTRTENVPGNPDEFDATQFIQRITPVAAYDADGNPVTLTMDATTFYDVTPGMEVEFEVEFENDVREPPETAEIHRAEIIVVGNGVTDLDRRDVYIVVPPADGEVVLE